MAKIGDTIHFRGYDRAVSCPIMNERERLLAMSNVERNSASYAITDGSYVKDRSSFGPTTDEDAGMFDGNVRCGGNVACYDRAPNRDDD